MEQLTTHSSKGILKQTAQSLITFPSIPSAENTKKRATKTQTNPKSETSKLTEDEKYNRVLKMIQEREKVISGLQSRIQQREALENELVSKLKEREESERKINPNAFSDRVAELQSQMAQMTRLLQRQAFHGSKQSKNKQNIPQSHFNEGYESKPAESPVKLLLVLLLVSSSCPFIRCFSPEPFQNNPL